MDYIEISNTFLSKEGFILIGDVLIATTVQYVLANLEMTSRFNIVHFADKQNTLNHAANDLANYIKMSIVCAIALIVLYYFKYGIIAALICLLTNILVISSIYSSYDLAFKQSIKKTGMKYPKINFNL